MPVRPGTMYKNTPPKQLSSCSSAVLLLYSNREFILSTNIVKKGVSYVFCICAVRTSSTHTSVPVVLKL